MSSLHSSHISNLKLIHKGKVRDNYDIDGKHMLIVATDRLSAFDVVMPTPIPEKGAILTAVTRFWLNKLKHIIPNHACDIKLEQYSNSHWVSDQSGNRCRFHKLCYWL